MFNVAKLHERLSELAPVHGVSIGDADDRSTWRIDFDQSANSDQRLDAEAAMQAYEINSGSWCGRRATSPTCSRGLLP